MAITLVSMPAEIIVMIAEEIDDDRDVSNFRLACRLFGALGRNSLSTSVLLAPLPESISRLRDISLDPFFSHHITTIVCSLNVFASYNSRREWQDDVTPSDASVGNYTSSQWRTSLAEYDGLLEDQDAALEDQKPLQELEMACRNFTNLQSIEIEGRAPYCLPPHIRNNRRYQSLIQSHGSLTKCLRVPWIHSNANDSDTTPPANYFLRSLLSNAPRLRTLEIDALAVDAFAGERNTEMYSMLKKAGRGLRVLALSIRGDREFERRQDAQQAMFRKRLKSFLFSAHDLQDIELTYHVSYYSLRLFFISIAYILPTKHTWSHLRTLKLSHAEMIVSVFVDFIDTHGHTLKVLKLEECRLQYTQPKQSCWSDIFIHLMTNCNLTTLELDGRFFKPYLPNQYTSATGPPMVHMSDRVWDVEIHSEPLILADALDMLLCSKLFEAHLHETVSIYGISIEWVKKDIIRDLLDYGPTERSNQEPLDIPTRHVLLFQSYAASIFCDSMWLATAWQSVSDLDITPPPDHHRSFISIPPEVPGAG